ncbi:hypothetical protein N7478_013072 [Penicillium angulare]|uniref:uncharacterized protein n=1 Tax=Penicillium angulare TaxID=116970 RepID=UPI00254187B2|nr:uncharacterized protein N7478_013072 [Penicillium angulare]KAJ5256968.1 hypothetical protein N7478_013072 [Penicillium angulare]
MAFPKPDVKSLDEMITSQPCASNDTDVVEELASTKSSQAEHLIPQPSLNETTQTISAKTADETASLELAQENSEPTTTDLMKSMVDTKSAESANTSRPHPAASTNPSTTKNIALFNPVISDKKNTQVDDEKQVKDTPKKSNKLASKNNIAPQDTAKKQQKTTTGQKHESKPESLKKAQSPKQAKTELKSNFKSTMDTKPKSENIVKPKQATQRKVATKSQASTNAKASSVKENTNTNASKPNLKCDPSKTSGSSAKKPETKCGSSKKAQNRKQSKVEPQSKSTSVIYTKPKLEDIVRPKQAPQRKAAAKNKASTNVEASFTKEMPIPRCQSQISNAIFLKHLPQAYHHRLRNAKLHLSSLELIFWTLNIQFYKKYGLSAL